MGKRHMATPKSSVPMSMLIGGRLAVDFGNAAQFATSADKGHDGWDELVAFLLAAGTISTARGDALRKLPLVAPEEAGKLVRLAIALRSAVRQILDARVRGVQLTPEWIAQINDVLAYTEGYERLESARDPSKRESDWRLQLATRSDQLEWLLAAIARSAAELVAEGPAAPLRKCANPKCGLFFYDDSRTGGRRWCSMATCGNRAKVAAHFQRRKKT